MAVWFVYPDLRTVTVAVAEGSRTCRDGDEIRLEWLEGKRVSIGELPGPARRF